MAITAALQPPVIAVEASAVEDSLKERLIGENIRRLRLKHSMGLVELGRRTGLSASFLSQLETGRVVPTLRNLSRIALVFHKDFSYFFRRPQKSVFRISRAKDRRPLPLGKSAPSVLSESLAMLVPDRRIIPCLAEFLQDGPTAAFCPSVSPGLELTFVLQGNITVTTKGEKQVLHTSDSLWIDMNSERCYERQGDHPARALIVTFPQQA